MDSSSATDERFADWVDGRLSAAERKRLERDLAADPELRARLEGYVRTVDHLRREARSERAPEGLVDAILARVEAGESAATPGSRPAAATSPRRLAPLLSSLAAAAALLALGWFLWRTPPGAPASEDAAAARWQTAPQANAATSDEDARVGWLEEDLSGVRAVPERLRDEAAPALAPTSAPPPAAAERTPEQDRPDRYRRAEGKAAAAPDGGEAALGRKGAGLLGRSEPPAAEGAKKTREEREEREEREAVDEVLRDQGRSLEHEPLPDPAAEGDAGVTAAGRAAGDDAALGSLVLLVTLPLPPTGSGGEAAAPGEAKPAAPARQRPAARADDLALALVQPPAVFANVTPPAVREIAVAPPSPAELAEKHAAMLLSAPDAFALRAGDRLFTVTGPPPHLATYCAHLREAAQARSGQVELLRARLLAGAATIAALGGTGAGREGLPAAAEGESAVDTLLLVVRPAEPTGDAKGEPVEKR